MPLLELGKAIFSGRAISHSSLSLPRSSRAVDRQALAAAGQKRRLKIPRSCMSNSAECREF